MSWICPKCNNKIEYLDFTASTQGWESGSAILKKEYIENQHDRIENHDYRDSGTDESGEYEYECSECKENINLSELVWLNQETDEIIYKHIPCLVCLKTYKKCLHKRPIHCKHCKQEQEKNKEPEPEETLHNIITPTNNIISEKDPNPKDNTENTMICKNKKCKYVFVYNTNYDLENEFYECPKCETINNRLDYIESIIQ